MKTKYMNIRNNKLYIGDYSLEKIAEEYKTPLYVYDEKHLRDELDNYVNNFKSKKFETSIVYATKAFLVPELCHILNEKQYHLDIVSKGDMDVLEKANFPFNNVVFHGNNKSYEELCHAVDKNIGLIVVDNIRELEILEEIACSKGKVIDTLFRFNPGIDAHTHKYIKTALYESKFGESIYDEKKIEQIIVTYKNSPHVNFLGCHSHIGSQIREHKPFLLNINKMLEFTKSLNDKYNLDLSVIDLGGGMGIDYESEESGFKIEELLLKMIQRLESKIKKLNLNIKKVLIEPGRSIVGTSGVTLYKCGYLKTTFTGKNYLFIDGGMTDNIRPALYQAVYDVDIVNRMNDEKTLKADIVGKCCESGDIIARDAMIPNVKENDIMVVYNTGAYTYSMSSNYNGLYKPAVIFVSDKIKIVSKRETEKEINKLF